MGLFDRFRKKKKADPADLVETHSVRFEVGPDVRDVDEEGVQALDEALSGVGTGELLHRTGAVQDNHRRWMHEALIKRDPDLYYEIGAAVWRFDAREWVASLPHPKLIIIPTADQVVPPETQYEMASLLPDAEVVELPGGLHESVLNRPGDYIEAISRFVDAR